MGLTPGTYHAVWFKDRLGHEDRAVAQNGSVMLGPSQYKAVLEHLNHNKSKVLKEETFVVKDDRNHVGQILQFLIAHSSQLPYSEGTDRSSIWHTPPLTLDKPSDCSSMFRAVSEWADLPDPFGENYGGTGNTDNIGKTLKHINGKDAKVGDGVLFGAAPGYFHVAHVLVPGDALTMRLASHGSPGMRNISLTDEANYHKENGHPGVTFVQLKTS